MKNINTTKNHSVNRSKDITFAIFTAPGLFLYVLFFIVPIIQGAFYSLTDWNGISKNYKFIGTRNYIKILQNKRFLKAILFNIKYSIVLTVCMVTLCIILAHLLNKRIKGITFFRAVYFFPAVLSMLTVGLIFNQIYYRVIPVIGNALGIESLSKNILSSPTTAVYGVLFVNLWQGVAMPTLIILAGLQNIPRELYEAATIDGANAWNRFKKITLPSLIPQIIVVSVLSIKGGLMIFDYIMALTEGGPGGATESVSLLIYRNAYVESKFSYAITESICVGFLIAIISALQIRLSNKNEI